MFADRVKGLNKFVTSVESWDHDRDQRLVRSNGVDLESLLAVHEAVIVEDRRLGVGNVPDLQVQEFILADNLLAYLARFEQEE